VKRFAAVAFAAFSIAVALPAHAFQKTSLADGSFEYFFAAPSLDIRSAGDLNLVGLSFIEGVAGGFRVGALFNLDWLGGEQALLASPASTWSGLDTLPRTLSVIAGGSLDLGATRLTLLGGTISLTAGGALTIGDGSVFDVGGTGGGVIRGPGTLLPSPLGGDIRLTGPSPIPEPTTPALLLAGLMALAGFVRRRQAER
jgi:hypothetical protein